MDVHSVLLTVSEAAFYHVVFCRITEGAIQERLIQPALPVRPPAEFDLIPSVSYMILKKDNTIDTRMIRIISISVLTCFFLNSQ